MENRTLKITDEVTWSTTETPLTPEEEDTIVTLVVVIVGILAAIILLFSMGIFIDCKTQKTITSTSGKRKRLRLKMPPLGRAKAHQQRFAQRREDSKCLAADMCPNGSSEYASTANGGGSSSIIIMPPNTLDAVV